MWLQVCWGPWNSHCHTETWMFTANSGKFFWFFLPIKINCSPGIEVCSPIESADSFEVIKQKLTKNLNRNHFGNEFIRSNSTNSSAVATYCNIRTFRMESVNRFEFPNLFDGSDWYHTRNNKSIYGVLSVGKKVSLTCNHFVWGLKFFKLYRHIFLSLSPR